MLSSSQYIRTKSVKRIFLFQVITLFALFSCTEIVHKASLRDNATEQNGVQVYLAVRDTLDNCGQTIDYDTLMHVYHSLVRSRQRIPHIDELLNSLIDKRNDDPRIDQMILIFVTLTIRHSQFQIPNVLQIFESILNKNDNRINEWVISFVGASIGNYPYDIPNGDRLVDFLEKRLDQVSQSNRTDPKENFGFHFLPPPKTDYITSYIKNIKKQSVREMERKYYYALIASGVPENHIETMLKRFRKNCTPVSDEKCLIPMKHIFLETKKHQGQLPMNYKNKRDRN